MESYPQLIPNMTKVVEPLKAYKMRHFHGEKEENIRKKYFHFDHGSFKKGVVLALRITLIFQRG
jgi:hypothetical protein